MEGQRVVIDEAKEDMKIISVRLPTSLVARIDDYVFENHFANRTLFIEEACKQRLSSLVCPKCEALNPENGKWCAVCGTELDTFHKAISDFRQLYYDASRWQEKTLKLARQTRRQFQELSRAAAEFPGDISIRSSIIPKIKDCLDALDKILDHPNMPILQESRSDVAIDQTFQVTYNESDLFDLSQGVISGSLLDPGPDGEYRPQTVEKRLSEIHEFTPALRDLANYYRSAYDDLQWMTRIHQSVKQQLSEIVKKD